MNGITLCACGHLPWLHTNTSLHLCYAEDCLCNGYKPGGYKPGEQCCDYHNKNCNDIEEACCYNCPLWAKEK